MKESVDYEICTEGSPSAIRDLRLIRGFAKSLGRTSELRFARQTGIDGLLNLYGIHSFAR